jgi:hypothetical protein
MKLAPLVALATVTVVCHASCRYTESLNSVNNANQAALEPMDLERPDGRNLAPAPEPTHIGMDLEEPKPNDEILALAGQENSPSMAPPRKEWAAMTHEKSKD